MRRIALWMATLAAICAGCTDDSPAGSTKASQVAADRVGVDVFHGDQVGLIEYAKNKLVAECMADRGYPQLAQAGVGRGEGFLSSLDVAPPDYAVADDEHARRYGFGNDQPATAPHVLSFDAGFDAAQGACRTEAHNRIGPEYAGVLNQLVDLFNQMSGEVANAMSSGPSQAEIDQVLGRVTSCLEAKGFYSNGQGTGRLDSYGVGQRQGKFDGPEAPEPRRIPGTVEVLPAQPARKYIPTPQESALAVAAAQCSRDAGFGDKVAEVRLRIVREVIAKHEDVLTELTGKIDVIARQAAGLVEQ